MPVLVLKCTEGFADRLQVLSHCIRYCLAHNTALCVDWSDGIWGNGQFDFHDVFELVGIKTMTKEQVLKLVKTGNVKINPPCWTYDDIRLPCNVRTGGDEFIGTFMTTEHPPIRREGDILVTNGQGDRGWHTVHICEHIRVKPNVSEAIKEILKDFNPNSLVVHLRGTDRPDDNFVKDAITTAVQYPENIPIYVVTDSNKMFQEFVTGIPRAKLLNPNGQVLKLPDTSEWGTHQTVPPIMKKYGVSKWQMCIELLADFIAIWSAQWTIGKTKSYYYRLARELSRLPPSEMIKFLGWTPIQYTELPQEEVTKYLENLKNQA